MIEIQKEEVFDEKKKSIFASLQRPQSHKNKCIILFFNQNKYTNMNANEKFVGNKAVKDEKEIQTEHDNEEDEETIYQDNNNFLDSRFGLPTKTIQKERARRLLAAWFQNYKSELESDE